LSPPPELAGDQLGFFRWGRIAGKVLVTNDAGDWSFLAESELDDLLAGRILDGHARFAEFQRKGFLRDGLDLDALAARIARRNLHVGRGPHVHVVTLTLRGSASEKTDVNMSQETAEKVVDLALQSTSPTITFELQGQGGEPLLNFEVLRHLVELARSHNQRTAGKTLSFSLASNFTRMTEEAAEWLIANDILVSTSLDGPASLHDWNRKWKGGSAHAEVVRWIEYFNRRYVELGRDIRLWHIDALMTTTRRTLDAWREVVDEYVARGMPTIHVQPLRPFGIDSEVWATVGYGAPEYLDFYRRTLDYILELNQRGVEISEGTASIFLSKILTADDPGIVDIQSPSGAGTAQIAYNFDGRVFPSEEARIVDAMGDSIFELGHVRDLALPDVLRHPTVRAIAAASLLDIQPMCAECWNKPFCGISPVYNFATQGDLFGQRPHSFESKEHMAVSAKLFELLANESDSQTTEILKRWTVAGVPVASHGRALREAP
jgi:His-Xaa-Ser system radical SAM maturase HxsB